MCIERKMILPTIIEQSYQKLLELQFPENIARIKQRFIKRESITNENVLREIKNAELCVDIFEDWYKTQPNNAAAIVFCPHRRGSIGVNDTSSNIGVASSLRDKLIGANISTYIGGDVLTEQEKFISGETSIMVATKAF